MKRKSLGQRPRLSVIRYVERTGESVVLNDAIQDGLFTTDPYILSQCPKSILCAPVIHQSKVSGIIYLENNLATGAFVPERVEVVSVLASQAAISLESARLYESLEAANAQLEDYSRNLERMVEERTLELQEKNHELEEANQHVQDATQRKSQFLAGMSHELRTPLNSIIGFSEVLLEKMFGELNDKQEDYVKDVVSSGRHLLSLINDILDLSKVEAGRMELELGVFDLRAVLEGSLVMVRERAVAHTIRLSLDLADEIDTIIGDERKVKQILFNLLSNAVKFTPDAGKVGIQAKKLGDAVRIAVWDTGIGIAREDQGRIFEEFQQTRQGLIGKTEGTGLGLALAKKFVDMHDGSIWVESMPGVGSTFTFTLPLEGPGLDARTEAVLEGNMEEQGQTGPVALIVEDDPKAADLFQIYLTEAGYLVDIASDGAEGLHKIKQRRPEVVILDILLPQVDGWAFLSQVKKDPATQDIPVIVVSILDERGKGIALGAAEYLVKPVDKEELLEKLKTRQVAVKKPTSRVKILVIDDDPKAMRLVTRVLESEGFVVLQAATSEAGLILAKAAQPDVVILDVFMPGMNGFEIIDRLEESPETQQLPIILFTVKQLTADEKERFKGRIAQVFQKQHLNRSGLIGTVRDILQRPLGERSAHGSGTHFDR